MQDVLQEAEVLESLLMVPDSVTQVLPLPLSSYPPKSQQRAEDHRVIKAGKEPQDPKGQPHLTTPTDHSPQCHTSTTKRLQGRSPQPRTAAYRWFSLSLDKH